MTQETNGSRTSYLTAIAERDAMRERAIVAEQRAAYAEGELSAAMGLPPGIGPTEGEARRLVDYLRAAKQERDQLRRDVEALREWAAKREADYCGGQCAHWPSAERLEPTRQYLEDVVGRLDAILRGES